MKKLLTIIALFIVVAANAQTKDEKELTEKTYLLSHTVFGSKDSATLEKLLAKTVSYGHSHGNLQTRDEMIKGVSHNQSNYTDTAVSNIKIFIQDKTAIIRYLFKANENKKDGTITNLDFSMMLVWVKEKGQWKLMARQAVSLK
ncbi:MAG: nuclear transport factor 2 family protein [Ferruginibacter sp.]